MITQEYKAEMGVIVLTVTCPPLATTKHTVIASAIADGSVDLEALKDTLTAEVEEKLRVHKAMLEML
jgi:hypothetical protein